MSDVCLILEGTYPYVTGGVSSCVYQLIRETPHINYSILYIGANESSTGEYRYPIPKNVRLIKRLFLFDYDLPGKLVRLGENFPEREVEIFLKRLENGSTSGFKDLLEKLGPHLDNEDLLLSLLSSEEAWEFLNRVYHQKFNALSAPSFIDFFYTWRFTTFPILKTLLAELPRADLYHSMCTGYAGLAGVLARLRFNRPFVLTEHGIYSHERRIEILQAQWLHNTDTDVRAKRELPVFKDWWISLFEFLSLLAYENADAITTLYEGNREKQITYGASREKIRIIPNGVDFPRLSQKSDLPLPERPTVALVGRVVPIKDIKTFIKASAVAREKIPNLRVLIVGPTEEDENYFHDCQQLVELLGLQGCVEFTGKLDVTKVYPVIDLLILSSISEGQPLVILEAFCQGCPVVATDVGSCRELIHGMTAEDRSLGSAGEVVPFGRPDRLGEAMARIMSDKDLRNRLGEVARTRVERYYQETITVQNYVSLYNELISERFWHGGNRI